MSIDLTGNVALVTGSSGGIGRGIALKFAAHGAKVAVNCLNSVEQGQQVVEEIREAGGEADLFVADVTNREAVTGMIASIVERFGAPVTILVNNAGHLIKRSPVTELTEDLYTRIMDVNLKSTVFVSQAVLSGMKGNGGGQIVNMTSVAAHNGGGPGASIYSASKAAVIAFTKGLAKEAAGSGIRVNAVSPGFIGQTAFHSTFTSDEARKATVSGIPLGREGTPEDVADTVLFLVSPMASYLTGETIEINGGMFMR